MGVAAGLGRVRDGCGRRCWLGRGWDGFGGLLGYVGGQDLRAVSVMRRVRNGREKWGFRPCYVGGWRGRISSPMMVGEGKGWGKISGWLGHRMEAVDGSEMRVGRDHWGRIVGLGFMAGVGGWREGRSGYVRLRWRVKYG